MADEPSKEYLDGFFAGLTSTNGALNAKLHLVRMYVEELIDETTKPEALTYLKDYAKENK